METAIKNVGHANVKTSLEQNLEASKRQLESDIDKLAQLKATRTKAVADNLGRKPNEKNAQEVTKLENEIQTLARAVAAGPAVLEELAQRIQKRDAKKAAAVKTELEKKIASAESAWQSASQELVVKVRDAVLTQNKMVRHRDKTNALKTERGDKIAVGEITTKGVTVGVALLTVLLEIMQAEVDGTPVSRQITEQMLVSLFRSQAAASMSTI